MRQTKDDLCTCTTYNVQLCTLSVNELISGNKIPACVYTIQ